MNELITVITGIIGEKFGLPASDISPTADFASMEMDSLVLIELAVALQERYGVEMTDGEIEEAGTIERTAALLIGKGGGVVAA